MKNLKLRHTIHRIYNEKRLFEQKTTYKSVRTLQNHCYKHTHIPFKVDIQILTQAPNNEQNPELWLKQQEHY